MKCRVYRRRRAKLPTDRVCPPPTRSGGDGRALPAILVAQAIDGGVSGGNGHGVRGMDVGRHLCGWTACGGNAATMGGRSRMWPSWSKWKSNLDWATCKTRPGTEVT